MRSFHYDEKVTQELHKIAKKLAVRMKGHTFSGKGLMSVIAFLLALELACDPCGIRESAKLKLFKPFFTLPADVAAKPRVILANSTNFYHVDALKSYCGLLQFLLNPYLTDNNIPNLEAELRNLRQESMTCSEYAQKLCTMHRAADYCLTKNVLELYLRKSVHTHFVILSEISGLHINSRS